MTSFVSFASSAQTMMPWCFRATGARAAARASLTSKSPIPNAPAPRSRCFAGFAIAGKTLTVCAADDRPPKRPRRKLALLLGFLAAALAAPGRAVADQATTDVGLTLNPILGGFHESFNDRVHVPPVPIPLIEARERYGPYELDLEGLPAIASVRSDDAIQGRTSTQLSIFEGVVRVWDPLRRFSAGIGQTLYNQSTHYSDSVEIPGTGETQFSRVTGADLSSRLRRALPQRAGRSGVYLRAGDARHAVHDLRRRALPAADRSRASRTDRHQRAFQPSGRRARRRSSSDLRYVNYTARYDEPGGGLSDRNVGLLPVIGYRARL